jgi:dienelactone hydrolase
MPRSAASILVALALTLTACASHRALPAPSVTGAERVQFPSRDGTPLLGWLLRPPGPGPFPAVVALHGCGGLYARRGDLNGRHRDWAERWVQSGYAVLLPDSFSPRGLEEICTLRDRPVRPGRERAADAYGALGYLQALPFVRADRVALVGWSNGGSTVLATVGAAQPARPPGPALDFRTAVAFYPGCGTALRDAGWLPPAAPLHVLAGAADDWTPAAQCRALAARAAGAGAPFELVVYDGAYHDFDAPSLPLRVRRDVATPSGTATVGTNEAARAAAIERVGAILRRALGEGG